MFDVLSTIPPRPTSVQVDNKNNCVYCNLEYVETMLLPCGWILELWLQTKEPEISILAL